MTTNSNFNFIDNTAVTLELPFSEHIEELRQRIFLLFWVILLLTGVAFIEVKDLVKILELPVQNVILYFNYKNIFLYWFAFFQSICNWTINSFFITRIDKKRNQNYFTVIIKFIDFIWIGISFFILYFSTSSFKLFFKL